MPDPRAESESFRCACETHLMHGICDDECGCEITVAVERYKNGDLRVVSRVKAGDEE